MNNKIVISIGAAVLLIIIAVVYFTLSGPSGPPPPQAANLTVWGTIPKETFKDIFALYKKVVKGSNITYTQKNLITFEEDLISALAAGKGPDIWISDQDMIISHLDKITFSPQNIKSVRDYKTENVDIVSDLYVLSGAKSGTERIIASALWVDPLVLYRNTRMFNSASLPLPPETWDELLKNAKALTEKNDRNIITISGIAMGRARNIPMYKEILSVLLLQQEADIENSEGDIVFGKPIDISHKINPTEMALRFYSDFANIRRDSYVWNYTFLDPIEEFTKETLAMMFDYSSNVKTVIAKNPHLSFDISHMPQLSNSEFPLTVANVPAFVVSNQSKNLVPAWQFVFWVSESELYPDLLLSNNVSPVRRSAFSKVNEGDYASLLRSSALQARDLNDSNPKYTKQVFYNMIESVADGRETISESVKKAYLLILANKNKK